MTLRFFLLAACALILTGAKTTLPATRVPEAVGCNIHFVVPDPPELDLLARGGFKFIRMDFAWGATERERGQYAFGDYDQLVGALEARGLRAILILDYGNPLYEEGAVLSDAGRQAFAAWAGAAAAHYRGRGILWEIWNEPNGAGFWKQQPAAAEYTRLALAASQAIKGADPDAFVIAPAVSAFDWTFLEGCFKGGLLEAVDAVSVHPYRGIEASPETAAGEYLALRALIERYAPGRAVPLLSGEWGYNTSTTGLTPERQGEFLARQWLVNLACGVPLSIWYDWRDDGDDPANGEHRFGTVTRDLRPKPAYLAAQTLTSTLNGFEHYTRLDLGDEGQWVAVYRRGDEYALAAWASDAATRTLALPLGASHGEAVRWDGQRAAFSGDPAGARPPLSGAPHYLKFAALDPAARAELGWRLTPEQLAVRAGAATTLTLEVDNPGPSGPAVLTLEAGGATQTERFEVPAGRMTRPVCLRLARRDQERVDVLAKLSLNGQPLTLGRRVRVAVTNALTHRIVPVAPQGLALELRCAAADETLTGTLRLAGREAPVTFALTGGQALIPLGVAASAQDPDLYHVPALTLADPAGRPLAAWPACAVRLLQDFARQGNTDGWRLWLDGDPAIAAEARLALAQPPAADDPRLGAATAWPLVVKIDYRFAPGPRWIGLAPPEALKPLSGVPTALGYWVYADGTGNDARCRIADATGQMHQFDAGPLSGHGWQYRSLELGRHGFWGGAGDGVLHPPLRWECSFLLDSAKAHAEPSTIYLGPLAIETTEMPNP